jgi:hypothetical protein
MSTYAQISSTRRPTDHDGKTWKHPGEYERAQAWLKLKRTKRDLETESEVHGHPHPPSVIFVDRAEMYVDIPTIPAPARMVAPKPGTGEAYIRDVNGTPTPKRSINFTPSVDGRGGDMRYVSSHHDGPIGKPCVHQRPNMGEDARVGAQLVSA